MKQEDVCLNKKQYMTRAAAIRSSWAMYKRFKTEQESYWCQVCGFYHLTTVKKPRQKT